jgi:hypothetical protein
MADINITRFDRSRSICYQECHRRRFLNYHEGGMGIVPSKLYVPFSTGSWTHHGLAMLLSGKGIEEAVFTAVTEYRNEILKRGLQLNMGEDASYLANEQCALVEGMLRAYEKVRLGELLGTFEVLEVEREDEWKMAEWDGKDDLKDYDEYHLILMARPDALLLERVSGDLYIQSFKTSASYDRRTAGEANHDVQGLSEVAATEARLYKRWNELLTARPPAVVGSKTDVMLLSRPSPPRIAGVRMEYIIKGRRDEYPEGSQHYEQYSPLIRGYMKEGIRAPELGWKREWKDPDGKTRKLDYRTWKPFHAWEQPGGVKAWIELLATGTVQPEAGEALSSQFVCPVPYFRDEDDVRNWYEQTVYQEREIAAHLVAVDNANGEGERQSLLNQYFPQYRRSCDWPSPCAYIDCCYSTNVGKDPIGSGLYREREPHHTTESLKAR